MTEPVTEPAAEHAADHPGRRRARALGLALSLAAGAGAAQADEERLAEGLVEGCLRIAEAPLFVPVRMFEDYYWSVRVAPSLHDFRMLRDDTEIVMNAKAPARCLVADFRAAPTPEIVEAALEAAYPGAWSRAGDGWATTGDTPLNINIVSTEYGGRGVAVNVGS